MLAHTGQGAPGRSAQGQRSVDVPSHWKIRLQGIGREGLPVVIIDNFSLEPHRWVKQAGAQSFSATAPYYPGVRAKVSDDYLRLHVDPLSRILETVFAYRNGAIVGEANFCIVTTPPDQLRPDQRTPHFDGVNDGLVALLHYLCPAAHGGTAFYRHRSTGLEYIADKDYGTVYKPALLRDAEKHGMPPRDYPRGSTEIFERIGSCDAAFNRAILYWGVALHAIDIPENFAFDPSPATGRLTVNTFLLPRD